jgi:hypothetical protein
MVSSDLMDRFERRSSMVRKCVKGVNWMTEEKKVLTVELLGYQITVPAMP